MDEIKLGFSRYSVRDSFFYEVEADTRMSNPFGYGYASESFPSFLNYVLGLKLKKGELISSEEVGFAYRFERDFPEKEGRVIRVIMNLGLNGPCEDGLVSDVVKSIDSGCVVFGMKSDEQRTKLGLCFLDDYLRVPSGIQL